MGWGAAVTWASGGQQQSKGLPEAGLHLKKAQGMGILGGFAANLALS